MPSDPIVIVDYARTPMGGFQGALAGASAVQLGAAAVKAAVERSGAAPDSVDQIIMGCVLPAGLGQAPARQAALGAGLDLGVQATTVNKMCGSGMQAAIMAHDALVAGTARTIVAGGMESMTNAPYLLTKHRGGFRIGHDQGDRSDVPSMAWKTPTIRSKLMGAFAEETAANVYQLTRADMDAYATESLQRAKRTLPSPAAPSSTRSRRWRSPGRKGVERIEQDEQPLKADPDQDSSLCARPSPRTAGSPRPTPVDFRWGGGHGAWRARLGRRVARLLTPAARICGHAAHAQGAGALHHGSGAGDAQGSRRGRLVGGRRRPVRGQRSFCRRGRDRHARHGHPCTTS